MSPISRAARDVDLAGRDLNNSEAEIVGLVRSILEVRLPQDDGVEFNADAVRSGVVREFGHQSHPGTVDTG